MADSSDNGSSSSNNLINAGLAILTLLGGFYYFKGGSLTSDRPVAQPVEALSFGEQKVEARLWEDPLKEAKEGGNQTGSRVVNSVNVFVGSAGTNASPKGDPNLTELIGNINNSNNQSNTVIILPVILGDGRYSEDREIRIRSRIAVMAGLGVRGFVPEDAEHVGRVSIVWPTSAQLEKAEDSFSEEFKTNTHASFLAELATNSGIQLDLRYEWFNPRQFYSDSGNYKKSTNVLVLWLRESLFDDDPLIRLPLLLYSLQQTNPVSATDSALVKLIGPRSSLTLRNMLPGQFPATSGYFGPGPVHSLPVSRSLTNLLGLIDIFCACPSAMDEVLVSNVTRVPRQTIGYALTDAGFHSFHNFSVTDAQLAGEVCDELKIRDADLSKTKNHLVLIAEWDTFYSRMVSLTFQAEVQMRLDTKKKGETKQTPLTFQKYINDYRLGKYPELPVNFHGFYYLQGLDGETVASETETSGKANSAAENKSRPDSPDYFRQWQPDANKAEGPSQLDYVARLGDRLEAMNESLRRTNAGQIKAIGVVGSDVYDTLIILQALRARFPEALFFTTDLDARFWHPKELKWSRNLLVFSGFGLALAPDLQRGVPPFRDNEQTAQYAATLAALGETNLINLQRVPPRRFEIGRHGAVDLSFESGFVKPSEQVLPGHTGFRLHPATVNESWTEPTSRPKLKWYSFWKLLLTSIAVIVGVVALCIYWKPAKQATWRWPIFLCEELEYEEEDFGGPDGAVALWERLKTERNLFCEWILNELGEEFKRMSDEGFLERLDTRRKELHSLEEKIRQEREALNQQTDLEKKSEQVEELKRKETHKREQELEIDKMREALANAMVVTFNRILEHKTLARPADSEFSGLDGVAGLARDEMKFLALSPEKTLLGKWNRDQKRLEIYERTRNCLDKFLENLSRPLVQTDPAPKGDDAAGAMNDLKKAALYSATAARRAAIKTVDLHKRRARHVFRLLLFAILSGALLICSMWWDTLHNQEGQPLSFGNGASAWPAQICRFIALVSAFYFCFAIFYRRRIAFAEITRRFRLGRICPRGVPSGRICAVKSWRYYTRPRNCKDYRRDIFVPFGLYVAFCVCIFGYSGWEFPINPVRGTLVYAWNIGLLLLAVIWFFVLTFITIDGARRCRKFILELAAAPTEYPQVVRRHFARLNGNLDESYLDEWIDIQLIAELTEKMGSIVYYPSFVFALLLIARNETWAKWSWPPWLVTIFGLNLLVAVASVLILQLAAGKAKRLAVANLTAKVKRLQNLAAPSKAESNASQAEKLLDEICSIRRGAFARAWESPLFGAMLLPSGGLTLVQALIWALGH